MDGQRKEREALKVSSSFENMKSKEERERKARVSCGKAMDAVDEQDVGEKGRERAAFALLSPLVTGSKSCGWRGWYGASLFSRSSTALPWASAATPQSCFSQQLGRRWWRKYSALIKVWEPPK